MTNFIKKIMIEGIEEVIFSILDPKVGFLLSQCGGSVYLFSCDGHS